MLLYCVWTGVLHLIMVGYFRIKPRASILVWDKDWMQSVLALI